MAAIRSRDTTPERVLRAALHRHNVRFRLGQVIQLATRRVRPDLVFSGARVAVFVDGCFWHGCIEHGRMPRANRDYWEAKIGGNVRRDAAVDTELRADGWRVVRIWEHEPAEESATRVIAALDDARH